MSLARYQWRSGDGMSTASLSVYRDGSGVGWRYSASMTSPRKRFSIVSDCIIDSECRAFAAAVAVVRSWAPPTQGRDAIDICLWLDFVCSSREAASSGASCR